MPLQPLSPDQLRRSCAVEQLQFQSTAELPDLEAPLCQERAVAALEFGTALRGPGYHVFVLGPPGVGKRTLAHRMLARRAATEPAGHDWCYLNDFADPQKPRVLKLPTGTATSLKRDMDRLIEGLGAAIPAVFESEDYRTRLQVLEKQLTEQREEAMHTVQAHAEERQVAVVRTPMGVAVAPLRDGQVIDPEQFRKLDEAEQTRIHAAMAAVQEELQGALRRIPQLEHAHRERVKELNREVALYAVGHLVDEVRRTYADNPAVLAHVEAVQADVVENVHEFLGSSDGGDAASQVRKLLSETPAMRRYGVNVMVDNGGAHGAAVIDEDLPTYANLFGRIEHQAHFGTLLTDFTLVRPGALHRANGGYLVLDARRLLTQPMAWEHLKRALAARQIRIDSLERAYGFSGTASLEPEPIPLEVKVVLLGDRRLYYLLVAYDPEFLEHFKVAADFEDAIPRAGNEHAYARLIATLARESGAAPFSRGAVAAAIEQSARLAEDAERLSTDVRSSADLVREAAHCAASAGHDVVGPEDVQAAIDGQIRRQGRIRERLLEQIERGSLLIDTAGEKVGQVNGLSVVQLDQFAFGRPSRITARVRLGKGEVVDIEREVELGGPIHSKGVLILAGYLSSHFAADRPFSLSATLVFEQSYGGVEGDSASSAELYALLSALADVPLRQSIAVTGSVNQLGEVQAIGGVNEKVEGFFDVCRARGLDGTHGVLIPASNVKHLMLRRDVVEACAQGKFRVFAVGDVGQGIEILTGMPAASVTARATERLERFAQQARAFATPLTAEGKPA